MDTTGSLIEGDEVTKQNRRQPGGQGPLRLDSFESFAPLLHPKYSSPFELAGLRHALKQLLRYDQHLVANLDEDIVDVAMETHCLIGRKCPWGGRPDHDGDQLDIKGERDAGERFAKHRGRGDQRE